MSDPGSTYRSRDEINTMRTERDPIERIKKLLLANGGITVGWGMVGSNIYSLVVGSTPYGLFIAKHYFFPTL